ncbi:MAG TPA: hypothetical protein VGA73_05215 [Candidatus Binatia bacterium]
MSFRIFLPVLFAALGFIAAPADGALSVQEILALKKAGVSEETIQMLLERERDDKAMALRAGTWKLGDGRTVYTTEGMPNPEARPEEAYVPCVYPVIEPKVNAPKPPVKNKIEKVK